MLVVPFRGTERAQSLVGVAERRDRLGDRLPPPEGRVQADRLLERPLRAEDVASVTLDDTEREERVRHGRRVRRRGEPDRLAGGLEAQAGEPGSPFEVVRGSGSVSYTHL